MLIVAWEGADLTNLLISSFDLGALGPIQNELSGETHEGLSCHNKMKLQ
jgi:hypothetical protein